MSITFADHQPVCTQDWPQTITDLLTRQREIVSRLTVLAARQPSLIAEGRTDSLLDLLSQRQELIDQFTSAQQELGGLTEGLEQRLEHVEPPQREAIRGLIAQISDALAEVMRRDEQDQAVLRSNREQVRREMSSLSSARHARDAYAGAPQPPTRFADQRG